MSLSPVSGRCDDNLISNFPVYNLNELEAGRSDVWRLIQKRPSNWGSDPVEITAAVATDRFVAKKRYWETKY